MRWRSTRNASLFSTLGEVVFSSLAPDGGLYVPENIPESWSAGKALGPGAPLGMRAARWLAPFFEEELGRAALERACLEAFSFPAPLRPLAEGLWLLELFHGPSLAFKDFAAQFMARLFGLLWPPGPQPLTVLVATSGDTGGAVAAAFESVPGIRVVILYPEGRVSPLQEHQLTVERPSVRAYAVAGDFDACQALVKQAFSDRALREAVRLTSANSISVARWLPQAVYYADAVLRLPATQRPVVVVPSGNLGNLSAGFLARRLGVPMGGFLAATNQNDALVRLLETGAYAPRPTVATLSNAMDVGAPSNLTRLLWLVGGDVERLRRELSAVSVDEAQTRAAMELAWRRYGVVLDPHTAVGLAAHEATAFRRRGTPTLVLSTAHAVKFKPLVEGVLGIEVPETAAVRALLERSVRRATMPARYDALASVLRMPDGHAP